MRTYALSRYGPSQTTFRAKWPYQTFFDGGCFGRTNRYGERPYAPFELIRNVRLMPPVFVGGIQLVVDDVIAPQLARFSGVDVNPCTWRAVYDLPVDEASVEALCRRFSILADDFSEWLEEQYLPSIPRDVARLKYFEVIVPRIEIVRAAFDCDRHVELPSPPYERMPPVATCADLHRAHPVVKDTPYYFFADEAFAVIERYVTDRELFFVQAFDL